MLSLEKIKRDVARQNYSAIGFPMSHEEFNNAAESFLDFLKLPQDVKERMYLKLDSEDDGSDLGYVRRKKSEDDLDDKEFFHYNLDHVNKIVDKDLRNNPVVGNFLEHADRVYGNGLRALDELLGVIEEEHPGIRSRFFQNDKPFRGFLRFLKYDIKNPQETLAEGHYDRGTITLALAESAPGLRIGRDRESVSEVEHREHTALFMPSLGLEKVADYSFTPAWHDVVKRGDDCYSDTISRWAIVLFADAHGLKYPTSKETHTPIVEESPGRYRTIGEIDRRGL